MALATPSRLAGAILISLAAAVCAAPARATDVGNNLAGESCRLDGTPQSGQPAQIYCGAATEAIGQLEATALPQDATVRHAALAQFLQSTSEGYDCGDAQWTADGKVALRVCAMKGTGWAHIVIAVDAGQRLYCADGPPSALPALEDAVAKDASIALPDQDQSGLQNALAAKLSTGIVHAPASDFAHYATLIESARLSGAADRYAAAEADYREALAIEERLYGETSGVVGQTLAELALQVSNQSRFDEAADLFRRASPLIEASADDSARARLNSYLALDAANRRQYGDALKFAQQAVAARRAEIAAEIDKNAQTDDTTAGATVSQGELAHALRIEAEMALRLGDLAGARASAEEALWIVSDEPGLPLWWRADAVALVGEVNERLGREVAAEHDLRDARDLDLKLFGNSAPTVFADLRLGDFYVRQQVYAPGIEAYRAAFAIIEKDSASRKEVAPEDIVDFAIAETSAGDPATRDNEIFRASQYLKAGVADQTLARIAAKRAAGDPALADLVAQLQEAQHSRDLAHVALAAEYAKPDEEQNSDREDALEQNEKDASANADALLVKVRQTDPSYADLVDPSALDLASAQERLGSDEALVSFVFGGDTGYAFVIRPHSFHAIPLTIGGDALASMVADLRQAFVPAAGRLPEFDLKEANALYNALIAPLPLDGVEHLIVVPGVVLSNLPLATLVTQEARSGDYQHAAWLVDRFALSEVPSLRAFVTLKEENAQSRRAPRPFLGLGAPPFQGAGGAAGQKALISLTASCREAGPISADLLRALPPLPDTAREVRDVGALLGDGDADVLLGAQASEPGLRAQALDQFRVLYFATHGILPGELHCDTEPALALAPPSGPVTSTTGDGLLQASEISELKLNADLVVLSACNTAESSDGQGGSALEGLSDSFFAAGARAVMASHWEVSSSATEALMTDVFEPANRARGLAAALRQAELDMIARGATSHPFYWASFTIIGDSEGANLRSAQLIETRH